MVRPVLRICSLPGSLSLSTACEVMLAGPLDQLVQLVLDTELIGLRVPNLLRGRDEAFSRQSGTKGHDSEPTERSG